MDRDAFVRPRRTRWRRLDGLLATGGRTAESWSEIAELYRGVCADLASARSKGLPEDVLRYLDQLAGRAHNALYGGRVLSQEQSWWSLIAAEFPRELRRQWALFLAANLLFYGPFFTGVVGAWLEPSFATLILPASQLASVEEMYSTADLSRGTAGDASMAGFYVYNNIGIAFRCFATGALAGLGSVFFLVYNGLVLGTVFGHLGASGLIGNLLAFTAGHTAWELTGIVVSGTAGLRLGWALVVTEGRTRVGSLRAAGPSLFKLALGTFVLLAVAASIEGFWSAGPVPVLGKYLFGLLQIVIVAVWLFFGGRGGGST